MNTIFARRDHISRIKIEHTKITHSHSLSFRRPTPRCNECSSAITVDYLILDSPKYNLSCDKHRLIGSLKDNLKNEKIHNLIEFVKGSKLIVRLM